MPKQKSISKTNTLLIGIIWSALYLSIGSWFILAQFQFDIFSLEGWKQLGRDFGNGIFTVDSSRTFAFAAAIVLFYPVWLWGWYKLRVVPFTGLFKITKPADKIPEKKEGKKIFIPQKVRVQSGAVFSVNPAAVPENKPIAAAENQPTPNTTPSPTDEKINEISEYAKDFNLEPFAHVTLKGTTLDLSLATDEKALLIALLTPVGVHWFFDMEQDPREAVWFSEKGRANSPIKVLEDVRDALHEVNPDPTLIPVIVLTGGTLMDLEDVQKICADRNIRLAQFDNPDNPEIPTLQSVIEENFKKKEA